MLLLVNVTGGIKGDSGFAMASRLSCCCFIRVHCLVLFKDFNFFRANLSCACRRNRNFHRNSERIHPTHSLNLTKSSSAGVTGILLSLFLSTSKFRKQCHQGEHRECSGQRSCSCDTMMIHTCHHAFVKSHRMCNTESDPSHKLWAPGENFSTEVHGL